MYKKSLILLTLLLLTNIPSLYYSWYIEFQWFDTVQHFLGGLFVAMLLSVYLRGHFVAGEKIKNTLILVGATIFIGVVWEFCEYIANQTLIDFVYQKFGIRAYFMGNLEDTIYDLFLDILGAISFIAIHSVWGRKSHQVEGSLKN